ncbi:MAG: hypothetical protein L6R36_005989 [Xanthoria steineri]|nr:MAG: hypothetical protein L6R36_005989 [Xanthoria steineri]
MATRSRSRLPRGETTHPIAAPVPQNFPICQPVVYLYSNDQAAHDAALAKFNNDLARLPNTNNFGGEGWIRDPNANHAYMIEAPALPPPPPQVPAMVSETRDERRERFNQAREEALERAAAAPRRVRNRPSHPEGYVDRRTRQRQLAEARRERAREIRRNNPRPPKEPQSVRSLPSQNEPMTRRRLQALREANREFYLSGSSDGWNGTVDRIQHWRDGVNDADGNDGDAVMEDGNDGDALMEDVQDLDTESLSSLAPEDAQDWADPELGALP